MCSVHACVRSRIPRCFFHEYAGHESFFFVAFVILCVIRVKNLTQVGLPAVELYFLQRLKLIAQHL